MRTLVKGVKEIQKETGIKGPNLFKPIRVVLTGESRSGLTFGYEGFR